MTRRRSRAAGALIACLTAATGLLGGQLDNTADAASGLSVDTQRTEHAWPVPDNTPVGLDANGEVVEGSCVLQRLRSASEFAPPLWGTCLGVTDLVLDHYRLHPGVAREEARRVSLESPAIATSPPRHFIVGLKNQVRLSAPPPARTAGQLQGSNVAVMVVPERVVISVGQLTSGPVSFAPGDRVVWNFRPTKAGPTSITVVVIWRVWYQSTVWSDPTRPWTAGAEVWSSTTVPTTVRQLGTVRR